jgi:hypothetical protein
VARDDQSITMNTNEILGDNDDTRFFIEVHLLAGKLVPIVVIHSLRDSRAHRHHTPNPQSSAAQQTQDVDHTSHEQSTRVHFGSLLGKVKNPLQSPRSEPKTITTLRSMVLATLSHLGGGNHQEKQSNPVAKHNHQVPLDAITQAMHLDSLPISQR